MTRLLTLSARQILQALKRGGFAIIHQKGSHVFLEHPLSERTTTVPMHPGDLPRSLVREIINQAGLSEMQFRRLV